VRRIGHSMRIEKQWDPISLGNDGRVWDGHHRIVAAMQRGITKVLVWPVDAEYEALAARPIRAAWWKKRAV
jgi:hypothetical protein